VIVKKNAVRLDLLGVRVPRRHPYENGHQSDTTD
jgi:hypothetical protein